jgi:hypothetical protein
MWTSQQVTSWFLSQAATETQYPRNHLNSNVKTNYFMYNKVIVRNGGE